MPRRSVLPFAAPALAVVAAGSLLAAPAAAQVYEVIHPEVEQGRFELEVLNGVVVSDREEGEERAAHEIGLGYGVTSFWLPQLTLELARPEGEDYEVEAFEFENTFLILENEEEGGMPAYALGFYGVLEIPNEGGIDEGAFVFGPLASLEAGPVELVGNFLVDVPFEDDTDPGLAYALQASTPVAEAIGVGFEAHGEVEQAFGDAPPLGETEHVIGPAVYGEFDLAGRVLEPRAALLFGLTDESPDAILSINLELGF